MRLAHENLARNIIKGLVSGPQPPGQSVDFIREDVFSDPLLAALESNGGAGGTRRQQAGWDVLVCNPPYVSDWAFARQSARSVRNYEPKIAQVPAERHRGGTSGAHWPEDVFYARLLDIAVRLRPRVMLFEVGDLSQALRVAEMALGHEGLAGCGPKVSVEVWRDWPDAAPEEDEETSAEVFGASREVHIKGSGHGRSVFIQCS